MKVFKELFIIPTYYDEIQNKEKININSKRKVIKKKIKIAVNDLHTVKIKVKPKEKSKPKIIPIKLREKSIIRNSIVSRNSLMKYSSSVPVLPSIEIDKNSSCILSANSTPLSKKSISSFINSF